MKLLIGGSPCTHWSIAKSNKRETEPSGIGWELFKNYLIAKEKYRPDYFLYENNKSMAPAIREQITRELGVEPICINSSLVSAQNRLRLYWTNIPNVTQPADKGIYLRDILEPDNLWDGKRYALCVAQRGRYTGENGTVEQHYEVQESGKTNTLTTVQKDNLVAEPIRIGTIENSAKNVAFDSQQYRVYSPDGKSVTLCGNGGGLGAKTGLYAVPATVQWNDGREYPVYEVTNGTTIVKGKRVAVWLTDGIYVIRMLSVEECKRLQTVPDNYIFPVSNAQAYKMLGNGWTVDVIAHILSFCPAISVDPIDVLSMYDGMACGHIALDKLGAKINTYKATEIDKYAIKTATHNFHDIEQLGDAFQVRNDDWHF